MTFARGGDAGEIVQQVRALAAPAEGSGIQACLLEVEMDSSQPPVAPVSGGLMPSSGLCTPVCMW